MNAITTKSGRYYEVEPGRFLPSVTTVISAMSPKDGIAEWRARVGEEEADRIAKRAADRGTFMHAMHEHTLDAMFVKGIPRALVTKYAFNKSKEDCQGMSDEAIEVGKRLFFAFYATDFYDRIGGVVAQETPVWSSLGGGFAGRLDLMVTDSEGRLKLIDFKSSSKPKRKEWIVGYELQAAAYSAAYKDVSGQFPDGAEVWISCESGEVQEFSLTRSELLRRLREFHHMVTMFHKRSNNA